MVGLGKMGLSHLAIVRAHPDLDLVAGCDATAYLTDILGKHAGLKCYDDFDRMLADEAARRARRRHALEAACADGEEGARARPARLLREAVRARRRARASAWSSWRAPSRWSPRSATTTASSAPSRRRRASSSRARSARSTTCAPKPTGRSCCAGRAAPGARPRTKAAARCTTTPATPSTWSTSSSRTPSAVSGVVRNSVFSRDVDDEIYSTLHFAGGASGQLSVNWSDESFRKMSTKISVWGTNGRITADRQECQLYLREPHPALPDAGSRLDGSLHDRPHRGSLVLPARRRVFGADRLLRPEHQGEPPRRREHLRLGARGRPGGRADCSATRRSRPAPPAASAAPGRLVAHLRVSPMSTAITSSPPDVSPMDRVLFGDNQFFGVNHMSEEKARAQSMRFQDLSAIIDVLDAAYEEGIRTFMCTSHDRVGEICDHFRANPDQYPDYRFYPCMPYAHKYANAVTEHGMIEALRMFLPQEGAVAAMLKGGVALASKDIEAIMQLLIDAEMKMFHGLSTPVIFMQNVITDLLLGLRMNECFRIFHDHVRDALRRRAGLHHDERAAPARRARRARHRQPDRLRQHQQDRLSDVRRHRRLRGGDRDAALPAGRDVDLRLGRDRAARGDRVRLRPAADRVDRVRRVGSRQHPADQGPDRRAVTHLDLNCRR